jgi:hypothetical protein
MRRGAAAARCRPATPLLALHAVPAARGHGRATARRYGRWRRAPCPARLVRPRRRGRAHDGAFARAAAAPAAAANPEDIELDDAEDAEEEGGEGGAADKAPDIQLEEKAVPVRSPPARARPHGVQKRWSLWRAARRDRRPLF